MRINFSHGKLSDHQDRVEKIRKFAKTLGRQIGILADLQGSKIRVARFEKDRVTLAVGHDGVTNAMKIVEVGQVV